MSINRLFPLSAAIVILLGISVSLWLNDPGVTKENSFLENGQVAFLLLAALLHGLRWRRTQDLVARDFYACLGLLCLSIVVRDVDIDRLGPAAVFEPLEKLLRGALVIAWLVVGALLFRHRVLLWIHKCDLAFSPCSRISILGIVAYGLGWFFDKEIFPLVGPVQNLIEESLELSGTFLFAAAALWQPFQTSETGGWWPRKSPISGPTSELAP